MKNTYKRSCLQITVSVIIAFFSSSLSSEAFLGRTREEVKQRLGEPEAKDEETNGVRYMVDSYAYILRYDASGTVDRCMITRMKKPFAFTPQEFNDLTKSIVTQGFVSLKSDDDTFMTFNKSTNNVYFANRSGAKKDWIYMITYKGGEKPDLTFFKSVMSKISGPE